MTSPTRHIRLHATTTEDGRGLRQLERDLDSAASGADKLGHSMGGAERDSKSLHEQIVRTRTEIRNLGEEFERTGDTSLFGDLRKERAKLRELERIAKEAGQLGSKAGGSGLDFGGSGIRPMHAAIGAAVAAAALAAPTIGAMIAGAVTGAVGLGGIAGGIFAASRDPGVERAWQNFASNVSSKFFQMGDSFVEPLVDAAGTLEQAFDNLGLEELFKKVAPYVNDIANGLAGFSTNFGLGLAKTLDKAGPILELLGRELPDIGDALGYMFSRMAEGKGTIQGFLFLMGTVEATLKGIGNIFGWLSDRFYDWINFLASFTGLMEDIPGPFQEEWAKANDAIEDFQYQANVGQQVLYGLQRGFIDTAQSATATADAINKLNDAMLEQNNMMLAQEDARLAYEADLIRIKDAVKEHGTSLKRTTEVGNANRQMIDQMVGDLGREHDAAIKAAKGNEEKVDRANAAYNRQLDELKTLLVHLGFEKAEIDKIIGRYNHVPRRITTQFIQEFIQKGNFTPGEHSGTRIGEIEHKAAGGPVLPGVPYTINERGSETVTFPAAGRVHPANLTPAAADGARVVIDIRGGEDDLKRLLKKWVRIDGAGSVQTAFGR